VPEKQHSADPTKADQMQNAKKMSRAAPANGTGEKVKRIKRKGEQENLEERPLNRGGGKKKTTLEGFPDQRLVTAEGGRCKAGKPQQGEKN